jgi:hypothetical protein
LSWNGPAVAGFLGDKAEMLGEKIDTLYILNMNVMDVFVFDFWILFM